MSRSRAMLAALAALVPASFAAAGAVESLEIVSQDVTVDRAAGVAQFAVAFNRPPIFVDGGSQPDAFQYEIDVDSTDLSTSLGINEIDTVIRGGEIWEGRGIPVRDAHGDAEGPEAGGWGPVRALVPFQLDETIVTFEAPLDTLGADAGKFRYRAFTTDNIGATASEFVGAVIPMPAAFGPGIALLGGMLLVRSTHTRFI